MGEAKRRGSFELRRDAAAALRSKWLGKSVESRQFGRGTICDVRHDRVVVRFYYGRLPFRVSFPLAALVANTDGHPRGGIREVVST